MPTKKSTRRSISFRAEVFERIRRYCAREGLAVSRFCEDKLSLVLDVAEEPEVPRELAVASVQASSRSREDKLEELRRRAFG